MLMVSGGGSSASMATGTSYAREAFSKVVALRLVGGPRRPEAGLSLCPGSNYPSKEILGK